MEKSLIAGGVSKCVYCESVYEVSTSNSVVKHACCSKECEERYKDYIENIEFN